MEYETRCGESVPVLGLGTWQMDSDVAYESVSAALDIGYRHVDTAQLYENEAGVGRAITDADLSRDELFLTTKVNPMHRTIDDIVESVEESLTALGVDSVDLLLIHWPNPIVDLETVITGLEAAVDRGMTRHIGVSNFGKNRLQRAQGIANEPIFTNQVLFHPWWPQRELLRYCQDSGVLLTGYSPLANGAAIGDDVLEAVGRAYGKTGPQVALRWATQHENVVTIPMSTSREHLAENVDIFDFKLSREEHERITRPSLLRSGRAMLQSQL
ncbi:aldo/keto reductase [Halovenus marina]|uniref:aldo/keto reductase n=1 Tax=Halovenus marina TaxID=3396621 RepID=UPI003F55DA5B